MPLRFDKIYIRGRLLVSILNGKVNYNILNTILKSTLTPTIFYQCIKLFTINKHISKILDGLSFLQLELMKQLKSTFLRTGLFKTYVYVIFSFNIHHFELIIVIYNLRKILQLQ